MQGQSTVNIPEVELLAGAFALFSKCHFVVNRDIRVPQVVVNQGWLPLNVLKLQLLVALPILCLVLQKSYQVNSHYLLLRKFVAVGVDPV